MARRRRPQDSYGRRARREGYAARSVYKLEEIDAKVKLFRRGDRVLDLGAYPGSWTVYAAERVQREGKVIGVDLTPFRGALPENAEIREGDVEALDVESLGGPGSFDVVLSDMAPRTSGHRFTDQARSFRLFERAVEIATELLAAGGNFTGKLFHGPDFDEARALLAARFAEVKVVKPKATRSESYEVFLVGLRRLEGVPPEEPSSS